MTGATSGSLSSGVVLARFPPPSPPARHKPIHDPTLLLCDSTLREPGRPPELISFQDIGTTMHAGRLKPIPHKRASKDRNILQPQIVHSMTECCAPAWGGGGGISDEEKLSHLSKVRKAELSCRMHPTPSHLAQLVTKTAAASTLQRHAGKKRKRTSIPPWQPTRLKLGGWTC